MLKRKVWKNKQGLKSYVSNGNSPREENGLGEVYKANRRKFEQ